MREKNHFLKLAVCLVVLQTGFLSYPKVTPAVKTEIKTIGTVPSFGTYSFRGSLNFNVTKPGKFEIGKIAVFGTYNGPYPWIMRVYTDNTNFMPIAGSLKSESRAGLVSSDGQFTIPLRANCPNFGEEWVYIPDINDRKYKPYSPPKEVGAGEYTECIIMGIDPRNADWVAGRDRTLFTDDDNPLGDLTSATPFDIKFSADFNEKTIKGNYTSNLYIELIAAP